jgi:hypothetical protein
MNSALEDWYGRGRTKATICNGKGRAFAGEVGVLLESDGKI